MLPPRCWERIASRAVPRFPKRNPGTNAEDRRSESEKTACSMSLGFHEKPVVRAPMASEEEPQHEQPGQEVGEDQGPPREDFEEPLREDRDQPQREHLEAAKQHEDEEEQAWVSIVGGQQAGGYQPEGHKGHPVEQGVLENHPGRGMQRRRISEPFEHCRSQQGGRSKGLPHRHVNTEKPDGDCDRTQRASDHAFDNPVLVHGIVSLPRRVVTAAPSTSANARIARAFRWPPRALDGNETDTCSLASM